MASMLGNSRTLRWRLCDCRQCRGDCANKQEKRLEKRTARGREERLWRREQM